MDPKMHKPHSKSLVLRYVFLLVLLLTQLGCTETSEPPVQYTRYETLQNDCSSLLANQKNASISGSLNIYDQTVCSTDKDGEYCKIFLGSENFSFLNIWMKTGGKNGMEHLPDPYLTFHLVVHADDGEELKYGDWVLTTLEPFLHMEEGMDVCGFRVKTILRSIIVAAENQPGEGAVNLEIPANVLWVDTGVYVNQGQQLMIFPNSGTYNLQDDNPNWDANSTNLLGVTDKVCETNCVINAENYGMLAARINEGQPFLVTMTTNDLIVPANGELYLTVNDCLDCFDDNSGVLEVMIFLYNIP